VEKKEKSGEKEKLTGGNIGKDLKIQLVIKKLIIFYFLECHPGKQSK
jgi:hypothetical protein